MEHRGAEHRDVSYASVFFDANSDGSVLLRNEKRSVSLIQLGTDLFSRWKQNVRPHASKKERECNLSK